MNRPPRLLLRIDATAETGLGHAVRTAGVIAAMSTTPDLAVIGAGEALTTFFPAAAIYRQENIPLAAAARQHRADGILFDLPHYGGKFALPETLDGIPLIVIDDWGGPLKADLVINGTVLDEFHHYPNMHPLQVLSGPTYCLIRPEFGRTAWRQSDHVNVVVVAGSGDRALEWLLMITGPEVDRSTWGTVTVITGVIIGENRELMARGKQIGINLRVGISAAAMADALANATLALVTGGMIVYEALAVGVPAIVFPQLANLVPEADWLSQRQYIRNLSFEGGMKPDAVSVAVRQLLSDRALAKDFSQRGRHMIDGRGMLRSAQAIAELLKASAK